MPTDIVMDAGTYKTVLYSGGKIVLEQPSAVSVDSETWEPISFGTEAKATFGRTPESVTTVFPFERGVISDYNVAEEMIVHFIKKAFGNKILKPRIIVVVPSGVTTVQHHSLANAVAAAGCRKISTIENTIAAAVGLGIDLEKPHGSMIVDIGGGTTEVAVISYRDIVTAKSSRIAGDDFDEAIIEYIRKKHNVLIGERTAEELKIKIGSAMSYDGEGAMDVRGRNLVDGLPKNIEVTSEDVREAISECVSQIVDAVRVTLEKTPPELLSDIVDNGIMLTGGGALLRELDKLIEKETKIPVHIAPYPMDCVAAGMGMCLEKGNI